MCCGQKIIIPPLSDMVHGVGQIIQTQLGIGVASTESIEVRRNVCRNCTEATRSDKPQFKKYNGLTSRSQCKACHGCFIAEKTKRLQEKCPLNLWTV